MKKFKIASLIFCCFLSIFMFTGCSLSDIGIGLSAYQVAVKNGYTGTEQEWLESLQGDKLERESIIEELENNFKTLIEDLEHEDINTQYATNLAMRSSVKVLAGISTGAGTIINYDEVTNKAHILTCFHVIADITKQNYPHSNIAIQFYGTEEEPNIRKSAIFLGGAPYSDIAILEATITDEVWEKYSLNVAPIKTEASPNGKTCIAIGNTNNKGLNAVKGNVSRESQLTSIENITALPGNTQIRVMRINAVLNHGNSGGGLFDVKGNLIGVVNAKSSSQEELNFAYAIPANVAEGIYLNVLNQVNVQSKTGVLAVKCGIGLDLVIADISAEYDILKDDYYPVQTVRVYDPIPSKGPMGNNDILFEAELKRGSEQIRKIRITRVQDLGELMWYARIGDIVTLKHLKYADNKVHYIDLTITKIVENLYAIRENLNFA